MKTFKLIVTVSDNSIAILKYVSQIVKEINNMGVRVQVEKISRDEFDEEMVDILRRRGIVSLPVLIAPDGVKFTGVREITNLFERNLKTVKTSSRVAPASTSDLNDYWMQQMKPDANESKGGGDNNDELDEKIDFDSRMRAYQSRVPKHRGGGSQTEANIEPAARPKRGQRQPPEGGSRVDASRVGSRGGGGRGIADDAPSDNIDEDYPDYDLTPNTPIRGMNINLPADPEDASGGEMDRKMLEALMDKFDNH
jgi:hypothetical protein